MSSKVPRPKNSSILERFRHEVGTAIEWQNEKGESSPVFVLFPAEELQPIVDLIDAAVAYDMQKLNEAIDVLIKEKTE